MSELDLALAQLRQVSGQDLPRGTGRWEGRTLDVERPLDAVAVCLSVNDRLRASNASSALGQHASRLTWAALEGAFHRLGLADHAALIAALGQVEAVTAREEGGVITALQHGEVTFSIPALYGFEDTEDALRWAWCDRPEAVLLTAARSMLEVALSTQDGREAFEELLGGPIDLQKLLRQALDRSDAERVRALLAAGADPNEPNERGKTPLEFAIYMVRSHDAPVDSVRYLLEAGASPRAVGNADLLPAVADPPTLPDDLALFELLLGAGWDPAHVTAEGVSALGGALENLEKLKKAEPRCGADERDIAAGWSMLERLEREGVVERLPALHALSLVAGAPTPELAERLIAVGAPVEVRVGELGANLLHFGAARGRSSLVESALARGLDPSLRLGATLAVTSWCVVRAGSTPLDAAQLARPKARARVLELLEGAGAMSGSPSWPAVRVLSAAGAEPADFGRWGDIAGRMASSLPEWVAETPGLHGLAAYHDVREAIEAGTPLLLAEGSQTATEGFVARLAALGVDAEVVQPGAE